jgi:hypothetical protein
MTWRMLNDWERDLVIINHSLVAQMGSFPEERGNFLRLAAIAET